MDAGGGATQEQLPVEGFNQRFLRSKDTIFELSPSKQRCCVHERAEVFFLLSKIGFI
jgi:hypothetical protein